MRRRHDIYGDGPPGPTAREERLGRELSNTRRSIRANQVRVPGIGPVDQTGLLVGAGLAAVGVLLLGGDGDGITAGSTGSGSTPSPKTGEGYQDFVSRCMEGGDHSMEEAAEAWNDRK